MPNPDTTQTSVQSISIAFPTSLVICVIVIALFQFRESIPSFRIVLWIGLLLFSYILTVILFILAQYLRCNQVNGVKAVKASVYTAATMLISLLVASTSWFRVPVASVFAPFFVKSEVDVTVNTNTSGKCCTPQQSLEALEQSYPLLEGISYGFYSFFGMMFGIVMGNGMATTC